SIAEQYATLETIFPNRVDLGLGRAPGTDQDTAAVLRRGAREIEFDLQINELIDYFNAKRVVKAYPKIEKFPPIYILGSSIYSAYVAAELGLPYAFASHFAPRALEKAVEIYRQNFKPSHFLATPYVIAGANVIIAQSDEIAKSLATTQTQFFLNVVTGEKEYLQPPKKDNDEVFAMVGKTGIEAPHFGPIDFRKIELKNRERSVAEEMMACSFIGSKQSVKEQILDFQNRLEVDEIMAQSFIFDEEAQLSSFRALKEIADEI
ncbi:MAG: MsnO8 family LLM class oxidoreductase, partial [Campylobacter concisus]|nr:MsnO8 family LLM class oxidoreductase [Campylobacter concisus]